jgi:ParB family chromosome partitioning protein
MALAIASGTAAPVVRQSFFVPLNQLVLAPDQVRQTPPSKVGIAEMAAMLLAQGQLNALQVTKDPECDRYFVHAGGRRWRGFCLLVQAEKIQPDFLVECKEVEALDATAVGLMENYSQEPMHAADEFSAFKALVDQGRAVDSIAAQFGVKALHVQRRLKLANLAPELMAVYRNGEIQLEQVLALVQLDDQKRQVMLFKGLSQHNRSAHTIRRMIAEDEISASDMRVKFVGLKTYLAAGGGIRSDLFSEKGERFLTDPLLLEMLVGEAFETEATQLRAHGWKWIDIHPEYSYSERNQYFAMPSKLFTESPVQKAKRVTLETELEALQTQHDECDEDDEIDSLQEKMDAVDKQLEQLAGELIDTAAQDKDLAGVVLTIEDGKIKRLENLGRVAERKQIMTEIAARQKRAASFPTGPHGEGDPEVGPSEQTPDIEPVDVIPERLMLNLSAQRTAAIQACMVSNQKVTMAALAQRMASSMFHDRYGGDDAIKISRTSAWYVLEKASPTVGTGLAATVMTTERTRWEQLLPADKKTWLQWFIDQPLEISLSMIVLGTAETVNAMQGRIDSQDSAAGLAKALELDMKAWWEPTAENYLDLVPKSKLIAAVTEAKNAEWAKDMSKLKKAEAIAFASEALAGTGWLPLPLRRA